MSTKRLRDNPRIYTLSATLVGFALIGNYTANQQNAIGNWFMLVGQLLETNSAFLQAINEKKGKSNTNYNFGNFFDGNPIKECRLPKDSAEIRQIKQALRDILKRLEELEKNNP